jgi:hypothetical protein
MAAESPVFETLAGGASNTAMSTSTVIRRVVEVFSERVAFDQFVGAQSGGHGINVSEFSVNRAVVPRSGGTLSFSQLQPVGRTLTF